MLEFRTNWYHHTVTFNPFVIDRPLPPEELIDRTQQWTALVDRAEAGHNSRLSAPRRYGKTTLLRKAAREAEQHGLSTVYVDFFGVLSLEEMAVRIEQAYEEGLKGPVAQWFTGFRRRWRPRPRLALPGGGPGVDLEPRPELEATRLMHELLDLPRSVHERGGGRTLVVFDEFQDVLGASTGADGLIRSRIQHHRDEASYVFAGSHPGLMAELFGDKVRPLYGQARPIELGPLDDADLAEYIVARFGQTGRDVAGSLEPLLELVRGHPQRAMLVAHHLWEATPRGGVVGQREWSQATETMFDELQEAFERGWEVLSANERRVLAGVAWGGPWGGGGSLLSNSTLARFNLSKSSARTVRDSLLKRGELEALEGNGIRMVDPLFEAWIATGRRPRPVV